MGQLDSPRLTRTHLGQPLKMTCFLPATCLTRPTRFAMSTKNPLHWNEDVQIISRSSL